MSKKNEHRVVLGGTPRADLLPPEVKIGKAGAAIRRRITIALVIVIALCGTGYALASIAAANSAAQLAAESDRTIALLEKQKEFAEVRVVKQQLVDIADAQRVGASTEIDWRDQWNGILAAMPAGMRVWSLNVSSNSPMETIAATTVPLQGARVATVVVVTETADLATVEAWLAALTGVDGYTDVEPSTMAYDETTALYRVTSTLHLGTDAYTNRFAPAETAEPAEEPAAPAVEDN